MDVDIYLRKSRMEEQADLAETLRRHKDTLYKIADSMGYNVGTVFEEVVSGESLYARPQMMALLEKVEGGTVDAVLCMDIDRLGRGGMRDQGLILDMFRETNTKIITPDHTYDLNDESDDQLTEFKAFFSRQEYKQITKRLRRGLRQTILEGCYVSPAPYGYRNIIKDKKPTLEIIEDEARHVQMINDMYCSGIGSAEISARLNAMGAKPHRGIRFHRNSILFILQNPVYIGKVVWNRTKDIRKGAKGNDKHITVNLPQEKWTIVDGLHPALITEAQFKLAQEIAKARYIPPSNDGTIKSPLAGLVRCSSCGKNLQRMNERKGVPYLMCNTPGCCAGIKYEFVEPLIMDHLRDKLADLKADIPIIDDSQKYAVILDSIKTEISKVLKQKDNLHNLLEQGTYDVVTYRERMKVISDKLDELADQEQAAKLDIEKHQTTDKTALADKITYALEVYNACGPAERNRLLKSFVDHIVYSKEKKSKQNDFQLRIFYK